MARFDPAELQLRSVDSYQRGDFAAGRLACDQLRCMAHGDPAWAELSRRNQMFYAAPLAEMAPGALLIAADTPAAVGTSEPPTLVAVDGQLWMVTADLPGHGRCWRWTVVDSGGDGALSLGTADRVTLPLDSALAGVRLLSTSGGLFAAGVASDQATGGFLPCAVRVMADRTTHGPAFPAGSAGDAAPCGLWPCCGEGENLLLMTGLSPVRLNRVSPETLAIEPLPSNVAPPIAADFVPGSTLAEWGDGWLAVTREHAAYPGQGDLHGADYRNQLYPPDLHSLHRFLWFDRTFRLARMSHPFTFRGMGGEACGGLAAVNGRAVLGWQDAGGGAWLASVPGQAVDTMLVPIDAFCGETEEDRIAAGARPTLRRLLFDNEDFTEGFDLSAHPVDRQTWGGDREIFAQLVDRFRPQRVIEVGTWKGASAISFARAMVNAGIPDPEVVCVDTWLGGPDHYVTDLGGGNWSYSSWTSSLRRSHGYSRLYYTFLANIIDAGVAGVVTPLALSSDAGAAVLATVGYEAELVYIDGGHLYHTVSADLRDYWGLTRSGGAMFGDDFGWPEVERAVRDFTSSRGLTFEVYHDDYFLIRKP